MTVSWILERDVFAEVCFDQMVEHFKANDIPYAVVRIIPFIHEIEGRKPKLTGPVVVYGSIGVQKLARAEGWTPGVFTDPETFNYETYAFALGDLLLNVDCVRMPLSAVSAYLAERPISMPEFFIKPNGDTKEFAGTVMTAEDFGAWHKNMVSIGYLETDDFDVVLSQVKKLGCEWRIVVVDGKISDSSIYRQYGIVKPERHIIPEVEEVVMAAHAKFQPAHVYVVDVCQVEIAGDLKYRVIEYNTFNSAGLYACDVKRIIDDINAYVERIS